MKKIIVLVFIFQLMLVNFINTSEAIESNPEIEKLFSEPVETAPKPVQSTPKANDFKLETEKLLAEQVHFTFGLGWAGQEFLGGVMKDGLGYSKSALGLNGWLGFSYTWIYGAPLKQEIINAIDEVVRESGGAEKLGDYDLKMLTRQKLGNRSYTYFRIGTIILLYPLVVQGGWMWPLGDIARLQLGFGLPLLLNVGINFDF